MTVPAALAGTVYEAAVGRSNGHCECDLRKPGNCGLRDGDKPRDHKSGHCCHERGEHRAPLLVAPIDPEVSDRDAIGLPVEKVMVLCRGCYVRRRNRADKERAARNQAALLADENTLFPSDLLGSTGLTGTEQQRDAA
ncbi:PA domain-containing protein [Streptomyces acidiscabies]|uniref:PA domain-containing protein n=1 Tax=Streptomyces acidiscabies TaxID=42234 RepID=A0ABU4MBG8_9ACTN|nr:PA domain-containing protein [Streptomyces acidiscabies]MDX3025345.1 PA domain-containing protein [Streptomyces acidiscabies]